MTEQEEEQEKCNCGNTNYLNKIPYSFVGNIEYCSGCGRVKEYNVREIHTNKVSE